VWSTNPKRVDSTFEFGGLRGDTVAVRTGGDAYAKVLLDKQLYDQRILGSDLFRLTPQEFGLQVLKPQLLSIDELIEEYLEAHPVGVVALRAPKLPTRQPVNPRTLEDMGSVVKTPGGYWVRWVVHNDEWFSPVSLVDVWAGAEK